MVSFREAAITDEAARRLLDEYFFSRESSFPPEQGSYARRPPDPAAFTPPRGVFLIVEGEDLAGEAADIGCGGIRVLGRAPGQPVRYELKHLWLQPHARGRGVGRALLSELEGRARRFGAAQLVLDTNASLTAAGALYRSSGYRPIPRYNDNPNATDWFIKEL